ncbi:MAG: AsnC family transcriptional regulator [Thermofilum sp. ex4484_82]|nr:Lrp/AsnC ligand binding domain-containing protein [Thermoproteales archaeon]OYT29691.1 MAG: AsnC family transcriptional regulator [Thermofilum sp. ex4484_82]OYT39463.1 MAG: AsnC family transcriptional regulator [Archaeoglobales archaeon ex4484_92]RLE76772.1 MAG: Lrp/AsnC family transcriptional regulator [Thermoprotei archaeon]
MAAQETVVAYVILVVSVGQEYRILEEIKKLKEVKDAHIVYGEYDIIAQVEVDSIKKLENVIRSIRNIKGVLRSITLICSG